MLYKELLKSKGFILNKYPEGEFYELEITDDEEKKLKICQCFSADIDFVGNAPDIDTLILQCDKNFNKCLFYYDCNSYDMSTEDFINCVSKI